MRRRALFGGLPTPVALTAPTASVPVRLPVLAGDPAALVVKLGWSTVTRMSLDGTVASEYPAPGSAAAPLHIAGGSNRTSWFTGSFLSPGGNKAGRLGYYATCQP
jgi:hypothetical protein